jgi:hypothetical protein
VHGYKAIPNGDGAIYAQTVPYAGDESDTDEYEDSDEEDLMINRRSSFSRVPTNESHIEVDKPRAQVVMITMEELAITCEIAINLTALVTHTWDHYGASAAWAGIATWAYILLLSTARLFRPNPPKGHSLKLWNHTAALYGCQWLFRTILFRSAIIHPRSMLSRGLAIGDFALSTVLVMIALTTRKGNKTVILEWEDGLEPSREPLASLFSLATFGWVDAIVWKGYRKTYELPDIWNLAPKDKAAVVLEHYRQVKYVAAQIRMLHSTN